MPVIPQDEERVNVPSQVGRPATGLRQVPIDILSGPAEALGRMGGAIGGLGEALFIQAKVREGEDKKAWLDQALADEQVKHMDHQIMLKDPQTPYEVKRQKDDKFKEAQKTSRNWTDTTSIRDEEFEGLGASIKKYTFNEREKGLYNARIAVLNSSYNLQNTSILEKARVAHEFRVKEELVNTTLRAAIEGGHTVEQMVSGIEGGFKSPDGTIPDYLYPKMVEDVNDSVIALLQSRFNDDNINEATKTLNGDYDKYIYPEVQDGIKDEAQAVIDLWTVNSTVAANIDSYAENPADVAAAIRKDPMYRNDKVREDIITGLEKRLEQQEENTERIRGTDREKIYSLLFVEEPDEAAIKKVIVRSSLESKEKLAIQKYIDSGAYKTPNDELYEKHWEEIFTGTSPFLDIVDDEEADLAITGLKLQGVTDGQITKLKALRKLKLGTGVMSLYQAEIDDNFETLLNWRDKELFGLGSDDPELKEAYGATDKTVRQLNLIADFNKKAYREEKRWLENWIEKHPKENPKVGFDIVREKYYKKQAEGWLENFFDISRAGAEFGLSLFRGELPEDVRTGELGALERPDGGVSTELSITIESKDINEGRVTNIPLLVKGQIDVDNLLAGKKATKKQIDIAIKRAKERIEAGGTLPSFGTVEEAVIEAGKRSDEKGRNVPEGWKPIGWTKGKPPRRVYLTPNGENRTLENE